MPRYIHKRKYKRVKLPLTDFSRGINAFTGKELLPLKYAVKAYNFNSGSGVLNNSKGITDAVLQGGNTLTPLNAAIEKLYFYKRYDPEKKSYDDKLIAYCGDKKLYYADIEGDCDSFTPLDNISFVTAPTAINYRLYGDDVIIFCSENDPMTVWDGKNPPYTVDSAPKISTACVHYERLFATVGGEKAAVWFSDDLDPTNWDISLEEAGYIEIIGEKGSLLKVIKFLDYVYVFRSYGISRLTAYAEQRDFSVITLFVSSGKIYPDTVTVCGDRIIFLAEDGLFCFDGYNAVKILEGIFPLLKPCDNSHAVSEYFNGCYYLACKADLGEQYQGTVNNALIEYDVSRAAANIICGADISCAAVISTENYCNIVFSLRGEYGGHAAALCGENCLFGEPLEKLWETPVTDFGYPEKVKILRRIYINTDYDIEIDINSGGKSSTVYVAGGGKSVAVALRGREFSLRFKSVTPLSRISCPVIEADIL